MLDFRLLFDSSMGAVLMNVGLTIPVANKPIPGILGLLSDEPEEDEDEEDEN